MPVASASLVCFRATQTPVSCSANMFPAVGETRFNFSASSNGGNSSFHYNNFPLSVNGHRSLSEEEQHLYNHHIIENFVESAREMNEVVLIPSKLKDLDSSAPVSTTNKYVALSDDLYSYYQMINVVKNDLFEPHNDESRKMLIFSGPKRKISRREQPKSNGHTRNVSASNLAALLGNTFPNGNQSNGHANTEASPTNGVASQNGTGEVASAAQSPTPLTPLVPLTSDQLIGQNSKQLTFQFIHHLHSLYTILDHFTLAADFITERYQKEVESAM